jgi:D-sedoheptulose 7-phosphate isomerase/D-glycero-D-manno-heptose 1,7-bisphosphate phosphatase
MNRPGILLDRDGTIIVDYHYVGVRERVQLIPGAADAIARFNKAGIPVAIITNQSGVARGFYPERNVHIVHEHITRELALHGAHIDLFLYSPYHPESPIPDYRRFSDDHKPEPGMALRAADALHLDLSKSIVVGDRPEDMELAYKIGAHGVYLGQTPIPVHYYGPAGNPQTVPFPSLAVAASHIIERITGVSNSDFPTVSYFTMDTYFKHYSDEINGMLNAVWEDPGLITAAGRLESAYDDGDMVFIAGNGGSAAIANHMEADHTKHMAEAKITYTNVRSLCGNQAIMTAIANDIGYDAVFSQQLELFANHNDVLVVFSVSGNSANIIRAVQKANEVGMSTIAIAGSGGGRVGYYADTTIRIPSHNYGVVEDVMSAVQHSIAQYIRQRHMSDDAIQSARF